MFSQESKEVLIFLLTITHPTLITPIRITTDPTTRISDEPLKYGTTSRSNLFEYAGVDITLPDEQDKQAPASKLSIANVTLELVPLARSVSTAPSIMIEGVLASALDSVEMTWPALDMSRLTYDASFLIFDLTMDALVTEPYPYGTFSPASFPGLLY